MGTSFSYKTTGRVAEPTRQRVLDYLESESDRRDWWAESIILLDDPERPGYICGDTKLFCLLDDDDAADCWMAMQDAAFIVERLEFVSREHGISWELFLAGEPAGKILDGGRDAVVADMLGSFHLIADVEDVDFSQYDRETLLQRYPDR